MQKNYTIKVYSLAMAFQKTLNQKFNVWDISFSDEISNGQGELVLKLNIDFNSTIVSYNNIIEVYIDDDNNSSQRIYRGVVTKVKRVAQKESVFLEVTCLWVATMLNWVYFTNGGSYSFSRSQAQHLTAKEVIDLFITKYPGVISYTGTSVENSPNTANIAFSYSKCSNALDKILETTQFWWNIGSDGVFHYHPISGSPYAVEHKLTMDKHIDSLEVEEDTEGIVNKYILSHGGPGSPHIETDATSQSTYGLRELHADNSEINDDATANIAAEALIADRKNKKNKISITINSNYNIESIHPGHFLTIHNIEYGISLLQIKKIDYNMDTIRVEVEKIKSFAKEVFTS